MGLCCYEEEKPSATGAAEFQKFLKDGRILCKLIDTLKPGVCRKPHDTSKTKLAVSRNLVLYFCINPLYRLSDKTRRMRTFRSSWMLASSTRKSDLFQVNLKLTLFSFLFFNFVQCFINFMYMKDAIDHFFSAHLRRISHKIDRILYQKNEE